MLSRLLPVCWCCCEALVTRLFFPLNESVLCWREAEAVLAGVRRLGGMVGCVLLLLCVLIVFVARVMSMVRLEMPGRKGQCQDLEMEARARVR